jgi:hypothetical protein
MDAASPWSSTNRIGERYEVMSKDRAASFLPYSDHFVRVHDVHHALLILSRFPNRLNFLVDPPLNLCIFERLSDGHQGGIGASHMTECFLKLSLTLRHFGSPILVDGPDSPTPQRRPSGSLRQRRHFPHFSPVLPVLTVVAGKPFSTVWC